MPWPASSHDGPGVTRSVINELNSWDIQGDQVEGRSFMDNVSSERSCTSCRSSPSFGPIYLYVGSPP